MSIRLAAVASIAACASSSPPPSAASARAGDVARVLQEQTQALLDAVSEGRPDVWERYTAPELVYAAEDGTVKTRAEIVGEIRPLPPHVSGVLRITGFVVRPHGSAVVTTYVIDESESYHGQSIRARYRETDTWIATPAGWRLAAAQVLALRDDPPAIALSAAQREAYVGTYALTPEVRYTIRREGDALVGQRTGREPEALRAEVADVLFVPGKPRLRKVFQRGADGRITGFVERRETWDIRWTREP